jgi:hypothetical protein
MLVSLFGRHPSHKSVMERLPTDPRERSDGPNENPAEQGKRKAPMHYMSAYVRRRFFSPPGIDPQFGKPLRRRYPPNRAARVGWGNSVASRQAPYTGPPIHADMQHIPCAPPDLAGLIPPPATRTTRMCCVRACSLLPVYQSFATVSARPSTTTKPTTNCSRLDQAFQSCARSAIALSPSLPKAKGRLPLWRAVR